MKIEDAQRLFCPLIKGHCAGPFCMAFSVYQYKKKTEVVDLGNGQRGPKTVDDLDKPDMGTCTYFDKG